MVVSVQSIKAIQPLWDWWYLKIRSNPAHHWKKETIQFPGAVYLLPSQPGLQSHLSMSHISQQLAVLTINLTNGLLHILSTGQSWAHTSRSRASNQRLFLSAPPYVRAHLIPKPNRRWSEDRYWKGKSGLQPYEVLKERNICLWSHSVSLIGKPGHHLIAHQWISLTDHCFLSWGSANLVLLQHI